MTDLDDPCWQKLSHAYGSPTDIPELLRQLARETGRKAAYDSEPWFTLWSSLCHQGDVYDASYAALPHIVEIACNAKEPIDFSFFQLPAAIEIARNSGKGPIVPAGLAQAYGDALSRLAECVTPHQHVRLNLFPAGHPRAGKIATFYPTTTPPNPPRRK